VAVWPEEFHKDGRCEIIADLNLYAEYKESGLPRLGKAPRLLSVLPNRTIFSEVKECNHADEEMPLVTITRDIVW
jgi:type I restriction enzyme S subunit